MILKRSAALLLGFTLLLQPVGGEAKPRKLGAVVAPVRLVPTGSTPIGVSGLHNYFGAIELAVASDGIVVSNRLTLERYLLGLNEVPTDWPYEALRAQAVAARTYALWTLAGGRKGSAATYGFDICATVDCQVFSGADVVAGDGRRWAEAVLSTDGLSILYDGQPILARYHSTSGGTTYDNSIAFPGERDYPYLQGVPSTTEAASPVYRWRVVFGLSRLTRILKHSGALSSGRVTNVHTVTDDAGGPYPDVVIRGGSARLEMSGDEFRSYVREAAPALFPDLYPSPWHTTSGRLPETLPSERFQIATNGKRVVVRGRGWGHGTGMSQWGAYGMAQEGATFDQILLHYYTGVSIGTLPTDMPIEVGLAYGRQEVSATGAYSIVDGAGRTIVKHAVGTWLFANAGDGAVAIDPPEGFGLPLKVGIVKAPKTVDVGEPAFLTIALSRPAEVRAETVGQTERFPKTRVKEAGKRRVTWLAPVEPGDYKVRVRVAIGESTRFSEPVPITVRELPAAAEQPTEEKEDSRPVWLIVLLFVGAVLLVAVGVGFVTQKQPDLGPPER